MVLIVGYKKKQKSCDRPDRKQLTHFTPTMPLVKDRSKRFRIRTRGSSSNENDSSANVRSDSICVEFGITKHSGDNTAITSLRYLERGLPGWKDQLKLCVALLPLHVMSWSSY